MFRGCFCARECDRSIYFWPDARAGCYEKSRREKSAAHRSRSGIGIKPSRFRRAAVKNPRENLAGPERCVSLVGKRIVKVTVGSCSRFDERPEISVEKFPAK